MKYLISFFKKIAYFIYITYFSYNNFICYLYLISPLTLFSLKKKKKQKPSLSHPSSWSQSTELISLCYETASHQLSVLHLVLYIWTCHSLTSSQLTLPPPCVLKSILYICVFTPVLPLGSSEPFFFFQIPYICQHMVLVFLFLTYFTVYDRPQVHPPHYK